MGSLLLTAGRGEGRGSDGPSRPLPGFGASLSTLWVRWKPSGSRGPWCPRGQRMLTHRGARLLKKTGQEAGAHGGTGPRKGFAFPALSLTEGASELPSVCPVGAEEALRAGRWPQSVLRPVHACLSPTPGTLPSPAKVCWELGEPMSTDLLGWSVLSPEQSWTSWDEVALCLRPRGVAAPGPSGAAPCFLRASPTAPPANSRGARTPGPAGPGAQGSPCNPSFGFVLCGMWTRHRREAGTCGRRAWQPPREQPVLGGLGAGPAERGKPVRGGRFWLRCAGPRPSVLESPLPPAPAQSWAGCLSRRLAS